MLEQEQPTGADQGNEAPKAQSDPSGPVPQEPTFDVGGKKMSFNEVLRQAERYTHLEPEYTKSRQELKEYRETFGNLEGAVEQPYQPEYSPPAQGTPYTPPGQPSRGYQNPPVPQQQYEDQEPDLETRQALLEARLEQLSFAQSHPELAPAELHSLENRRGRMEQHYGTVIPLELAYKDQIVENGRKFMAEQQMRQAQAQVLAQQQAAQEAQRQASQQAPPVVPGEGQAVPQQEIGPTSWDDVVARHERAAQEEMDGGGHPT